MARSPLFGSVSRAFRVATIASRERPDLPPVDELIDMCYSRRRFLGASAAVAAALATGCGRTEAPPPVQTTPPPSGRPQTPRIAIVGAGVAGLNAAYKLKQAGLTATVYEGANRTGGRMFTATDLLGPGLTTELGGEFIDSTHTEMLALMTEFGLDKLDVQAPAYASLKPETYFVNGRHYTQAQAARAFVPLAKRLAKDYDALGDVVNYNTEGGGTTIDRQTITQYFDHIGATGWMRELLDVAYVTEYGLDAGEQSALNFVFLIGTGDLEAKDELTLLGESDERYKVKGGNQRVVDELARRVASQIRPLHRLEAIRSRNGGYTLTFQADGKAIDEDAEIVLLAIPFSILRDVKISVDLPPLKTRAIRDLGYGTNAKVLVGFKNRPWEKLGYTGATYSDESFQLAWSNSFMQAGPAGGLTLYSGGRLGIDAGQGTAEEAAVRLMGGIERAYPGTTNDRNGKVSRFHWPSYPWTKGSYSCYKPGQWTTIAGSEGLPVGDLFFAGEHCSYDFQGFMNGGAQSGADAAKAIMGRASTAKAARVYSRRALVHLA